MTMVIMVILSRHVDFFDYISCMAVLISCHVLGVQLSGSKIARLLRGGPQEKETPLGRHQDKDQAPSWDSCVLCIAFEQMC